MKRVIVATFGSSARRVWSAVCVATLLVGSGVGCSASSVQSFTAAGEQASVSRFKTFGVVIPDAADLKENQMKPETLQKLAVLTVQHMQGLGYQVVEDPKTADMLIGLSPEARLYGPLLVVNDSATTDTTLDEHFDAEGTLTVSFIDMKAKQIVLRRVAKTRVNATLGDEQMREIIASAFEGVPRSQ
jgi:hypothetical protein